ncbi:MAG: endonuclease/exonuclease/phosphatase family metal-dependent hydrolase [Planctomycetota bacterium]|jgi:endonuclease/exonuclease/phosphatase family metal-dependent hydrolase
MRTIKFRLIQLVVMALLVGAASLPAAVAQEPQAPGVDELRVLTWNIWHGAREDGVEAGPTKAAEVLRASGADLIALQETYGSGELLAESLGFHFHPRGTNVSILSRYPVIEDLSVHEEFQCVGALIQLPSGEKVAFYAIWLPYSGEIWQVGTRDTSDPAAMRAACDASAVSLTAMWAAMEVRLAEKHPGVPMIVAGDFNSMSHLDYGEVGVDQYGVAIDWDTSQILARAGFLDSYREAHPVIDRQADATWSPRFPRQSQDRIDFIYYRAPGWRTSSSSVIRDAPLGFPSDHAALVSSFTPAPPRGRGPRSFRALSYNIKHGLGLDGRLDLGRTAAVLRSSNADVIALQEVDLCAKRSGYRNQVNALAAQLGMHPAFGSFMDYQGGQYGMAALSRFPVVRAESLRLPDGNEPRVALALEVQLPGGERLLMLNVHFDWVEDDRFRVAQAKVVRDYLAQAKLPWILMGDFNDGPASATLDLFREVGVEAPKPAGESATIPADQPTREIDFIFHSKDPGWISATARVLKEELASDHRPVLAVLGRDL